MTVFLAPENVGLDTKITSLSGLIAEIWVLICFRMLPILKIQIGRHIGSGRSGSYQKLKAMIISSTWKNGAFVQHVPINLLSHLTKLHAHGN